MPLIDPRQMEDALNNAVLLYTWTDVEKMTYAEIMSLSLAQIAYLINTVDTDNSDPDTLAWRGNIVNEWNRNNVT